MKIFPLLLALLAPVVAFAQEPGQTLATDQAIPGLMFFTLGAVLIVAIGSLLYFLRRRSNRAAMERVLKD